VFLVFDHSLNYVTVKFVHFNCECSLVDCSSLNTENMPAQIMLKLPTGETVAVACSMPSIVILPSLTSTELGTVVSQSPTTSTVSALPMKLMTGMVSSQPSVPLHHQASLGLPAEPVTGSNSQSGTAFDLQESGLTALGIAASTREVSVSNVACICVISYLRLEL